MKTKGSLFFTAIGLLACSSPERLTPVKTAVAPQGPALAAHFKDLKYPEFNYLPPKPLEYRHEIQPGLVAYLISNKELPRIELMAYFKEPSLSADSAEIAVQSLISSQLIHSGAAGLSPAEVSEKLEFSATKLYANIGNRYASFSLDIMSKEWNSFYPQIQSLVLEPQFDSLQLDLQKKATLQNIAHKYDHPKNLSADLYSQVLYGSHPLFWSLKPQEVDSLTRTDLQDFFQNRFRADTVYIGVSGDFEVEQMKSDLQKLFAKWPKGGMQKNLPAEPEPKMQKGVFLIDRKTEQTQIRMGQPFVKRPHPDYYPATLASYILGAGGFGSRLVASVRTDHGLAYSIRSFTGSNYDFTPTSGVHLQTKNASALQALALIQQNIDSLITHGPTDDEMEKAKDGLIASLPSIFDTPTNTMDAFLNMELNGRALNHFEVYPEKIKAITKEQVKEVLIKYFKPENMSITLVGPLAEIKAAETDSLKLANFGPLQILTPEDLEKR